MSRGKRLRFSILLRGYGYGGRRLDSAKDDEGGGLGGRVEEGNGDVSAKMRAAATASAEMLNSAVGVTCRYSINIT